MALLDHGPKRLILDTNALMAPFQFSFNLDLELERVLPGVPPIVPTPVVRELEQLAWNGDRWAKAALTLSSKYERIEIKGSGDAPIFNLALNMSWPVLTMDRRLRDNLLKRGIPVVFVRDKGKLELREH
jgi:rRNA-processing protein FCF1